VAVIGAIAFGWLFTLDVHVAERGADGVPAFCGSAYDVALIKRDGYMGGEVPANEAAIDRACVDEATTDVVLACLAALTALGGTAYALRLHGRRSQQEGRRRHAW
jgi:hypothetical protein